MKKMIALLMMTICSVAVLPSTAMDVADTKAATAETVVDDLLCNIRIKGSYDGRSVDVTVTVEAPNCAKAAGEVLKAFTTPK